MASDGLRETAFRSQHTYTLAPQCMRGFPPPPPWHKDLSDQRSDLQCLSHRGRQENTQIYMYYPVRHTRVLYINWNVSLLPSDIKHQTCTFQLREAATTGPRGSFSRCSISYTKLKVPLLTTKDKTERKTSTLSTLKQSCYLKTFSYN